MPKDTIRQKGVTPNCNRETDRPNQPQNLQDIVPDCYIGDMAKWTCVLVENETPCLDHKIF